MQLSDNEQVTDAVRQIRRLIAASMDGVTAEKLRQNGAQYVKNYGVALPRLRQIASQFEPSAPLAEALWQAQGRETAIVALLLTPVRSVSVEQAVQLAQHLPTAELQMVAASHLFARMDDVEQLVQHFAEQKMLNLACLTATHAIDRLSEQTILQVVQQVASNNASQALVEATITLLMRLGEDSARHDCLKKSVAILRNSQNELCQRAAEFLSD